MKRSLSGTFSVVALDLETRDLGVAVASKYFAVSSAVPWARVGVGSVATQAWVCASYALAGLPALEHSAVPAAVVADLVARASGRDLRQVAIIDAHGRVAQHTGRDIPRWAGHLNGAAQECVRRAG